MADSVSDMTADVHSHVCVYVWQDAALSEQDK